MDGKDINEVWDWQEDVFRLDVESPLAISQSLWEDFSQSEADVGTLFTSTPAKEITDTKSSSLTIEKQENVELSSSDLNLHEDSPRLKRRRMLHFSGEQAHLSPCSLHLDSVSETLVSYNDPFIGGCESFQMHEPSSTGSMWYMGNDESLSSVDDAVEQSAESWMARCFNDRDGQSAQDQLNVGDSMSAMPEDYIFERQGEAGQGVQSIISSCRGTMTGRRIGGGNSRPKLLAKLATPVAYPFAVVKPSGMQGDVTLNDINQRIMMPPSRPLSHVAAASLIIEDGRLPTPSIASSAAAPSGKSVVALTKIHTEGKGTITIMRTKN